MNARTSVEGALASIEELRLDSKIGKAKHFAASDRQRFWHTAVGIPAVIANLFVGIVLVNLQGKSAQVGLATAKVTSSPQDTAATAATASAPPLPEIVRPFFENDHIAMATILLAFGAASMTAIQTFFNFHKTAEGHRAIGNRYVHISRQCKALQQRHRDIPFEAEAIWSCYDKLYAEYNQINTEAESFPTNHQDLAKARKAPEISPYKPPKVDGRDSMNVEPTVNNAPPSDKTEGSAK